MLMVPLLVSVCIIVVCWCNYIDFNDKNWLESISKPIKFFKCSLFLFIMLSVIKTAIPTTKQMATIYIIPKIANSTLINQTLPTEMNEIYIMAKDWMRETLSQKETTNTKTSTESKK